MHVKWILAALSGEIYTVNSASRKAEARKRNIRLIPGPYGGIFLDASPHLKVVSNLEVLKENVLIAGILGSAKLPASAWILRQGTGSTRAAAWYMSAAAQKAQC